MSPTVNYPPRAFQLYGSLVPETNFLMTPKSAYTVVVQSSGIRQGLQLTEAEDEGNTR